jgi:hypothetical protein
VRDLESKCANCGAFARSAAFIDDICGASYSIRFTSILITIWNRDANHAEGVQRILDTVLSEVPEELIPKPSAYYYKRHSDHAGFSGAPANKEVEAAKDEVNEDKMDTSTA